MKKNSWLLIILLILLLVLPVQADKKYWIDAVHVNARILPDGNLEIEETREYRFQGGFRWADYRLPLTDLGTIQDFSIQDGEMIYTENETENPGTFTKSIGSKEFYVKWFYTAKNESRRFTLRYRVTEAVKVYEDIAEFYFQFVGSNSPKKIGRVDIWLTLPQAAVMETVNAWAHGPLHGQLEFENGGLHLHVAPLPQGNYWEVRAIFPPEWLQQDAARRMPGTALATIQAEEKGWVEKANAKRAEREDRLAQRPKAQQF
ncbi:DUF2207 domain-containing protein, partial [bacterium]|nr:DUF2207 domain-containing protein [bacterium]